MLEGFVKIPLLSGSSFLSVTSNGLNFNNNVVYRMNKAKYIVLLLNEDKKQLAIQKCDENTEDKISFFRDEKNLKNGVRFNNRETQIMIAQMMNWNLEQYNYRVDGIYYEKEQAMIFDLNMARKFKKRIVKNSTNN